MKKVIKKYRDNSITPEEVEYLHDYLISHTDEQLADAIYDDWKTFEPQKNQYDLEAEKRVKQRLSQIIKSNKQSQWHDVFVLIGRVAAILIIGLLCYSSYYFYNSNKELGSQLFCVSTNSGERVNIVLPDSSLVDLNSSSDIKYTVSDFKGDNRKISFNGEAYFDIKTMPHRPFIIDAGEIEVIVKGTIFNFMVREGDDEAVLSLLKGNVQLTSRKTAETVDIHPNEKAVINYVTGNIEVIPIGINDNITAWRSDRLIFVNATYQEVISQLGKFYGDSIFTSPTSEYSERFTGMLPLNNLAVAINIVSTTFQ